MYILYQSSVWMVILFGVIYRIAYVISDHYLDPRLRIGSYLILLFGSLSENENDIQAEKRNSNCQY